MAKNDFDMDFGFDEDFDFDLSELADSDEDADIDFMNLDLGEEQEMDMDAGDGLDLSEFDLEGLDLGDMDLSEDLSFTGEDFDGEDYQDMDFASMDFDLEEAEEDEPYEEEDAYQAPAWQEEPEFIGGGRRAPMSLHEEEEEFDDSDLDDEDFENSVYGRPVKNSGYMPQDYQEAAQADPEEYDEPDYPPQERPPRRRQEPRYPDDRDEDEDDAEARMAAEEEARASRRRERQEEKERRKQERKQKREAAGPSLLSKLLKLYLSPPQEEPAVDPNNPRRRRRKRTKVQIFKEVYLPPVLAGLTIVLMLVFVIGSVTNAIERRKIQNDIAMKESQDAEDAADRQQKEMELLMEEAEILAMGYDYEGAITKLDSYSGEMPQEMIEKRAEYQRAQGTLVEWKDYSSIPNLSFHMLVADPARAYADKTYGGQYNRNFVTVDEFEKILQQLYDGGYVLVDYDSFTETNTGLDGNAAFFTVPIALPEGKKPIMITETMVNYYDYMVDSNDDDEPDKGGAGFAFRLVVTEQGEIKAQMVDANGQTVTGNFDLVPILEDFIKAHPDFVYKGARAILAVSGDEGIFGYRVNNALISTKGQAYYDEQVAGATEVVQALHDRGYTIACYTYGDVAYKEMSATQIQADMQQWTNQIVPILTPIVGEVDIIIFAKASNIGDYANSNAKFEVLYSCGFRIFVKHGADPYAEVNNTYVAQSRLMVTGENMAGHSDMFAGIFDPAPLMNNLRGNVPIG